MAVHACVLFKKSTREETREETGERFLVNWIDTQGVDSVNQKTLPVLLPSFLPSWFF